MDKMIPHLWFDSQAEDAAKFYTSTFNDSKIENVTRYMADTPSNKPKGSVLTVEFVIEGQKFVSLNGGPHYKINPSISFLVRCTSFDEIAWLWNSFVKNGDILMPLDKYPFSEKFGWVQDKFGLSWQLFYIGDQEIGQKIVPHLLFVGE